MSGDYAPWVKHGASPSVTRGQIRMIDVASRSTWRVGGNLMCVDRHYGGKHGTFACP